jgi:hypothetical protein
VLRSVPRFGCLMDAIYRDKKVVGVFVRFSCIAVADGFDNLNVEPRSCRSCRVTTEILRVGRRKVNAYAVDLMLHFFSRYIVVL